jgi:hypothetical protein
MVSLSTWEQLWQWMGLLLKLLSLHGQEVTCFRNGKGLQGVVSQVACDTNANVRFVQTDWPGATYNLSCFCEAALLMLYVEK